MQCTHWATGGADAAALTAGGQQVGAVAAEAAVALVRSVIAVADPVTHPVGVDTIAAAALIQVDRTVLRATCRGSGKG